MGRRDTLNGESEERENHAVIRRISILGNKKTLGLWVFIMHKPESGQGGGDAVAF
jgi:hypothetical protein